MPKNKLLKVGVMSFRTELEELALILSRHSNQQHSCVPVTALFMDMKSLKAGRALCRALSQHSLGEAGPGLEVRYVALELIQSPSERLSVELC